jgi:hypothetical protein
VRRRAEIEALGRGELTSTPLLEVLLDIREIVRGIGLLMLVVLFVLGMIAGSALLR